MRAEFIAAALGNGLNAFADSYLEGQRVNQARVQAEEQRSEARRRRKLEEAKEGYSYNKATDELEPVPGGGILRNGKRIDDLTGALKAVGTDAAMSNEYSPYRKELNRLLFPDQTKETLTPLTAPAGREPNQNTGLVKPKVAPSPVITSGKKAPVSMMPKKGLIPPEYEQMAGQIERGPIVGYDPSKYSQTGYIPKDAKMQMQDRVKRAENVRIEGMKKGSEKPSDAQGRAGGFASRVRNAMSVMDQLAATGFNRAETKYEAMSDLGNMPLVGKYAKRKFPEPMIMQDQAERNFLNAVLRRESGATISPSEFRNGEIQYFPRPGDTEKVLAQKRQNRIDAQSALEAEAGDSYMQRISERQQANQGAGPKVGEVDGDYEFVGGDPADQKAWRKVNSSGAR